MSGIKESVHLKLVSAYGRLKMQSLYVSGTRKKVSLRGVHSWEGENVGFICGWDQNKCPVKRRVHL